MGATNQRIAELHNIRLCGRPCPRKNPTHNIISRMFIAIAAFLKLIISLISHTLHLGLHRGYKTGLLKMDSILQRFTASHNSQLYLLQICSSV